MRFNSLLFNLIKCVFKLLLLIYAQSQVLSNKSKGKVKHTGVITGNITSNYWNDLTLSTIAEHAMAYCTRML